MKHLIDPKLSPEYKKIAIEAIMLKIQSDTQKKFPKHFFNQSSLNDVLLHERGQNLPFYDALKGDLFIDKTTTILKKDTKIVPTCCLTPEQIETEIEKYLFRKRPRQWNLNLFYHNWENTIEIKRDYFGLSAHLCPIGKPF